MKNPETSRKATPKSPLIEKLLFEMCGVNRVGAISESICTSCLCKAGKFNDAISEKEYTISGLCQTCQDRIFG